MTLKQRLFVKKYIDNSGNGTQAALEAYDTTDANVAHSIASENLRKPTVRLAIDQALQASGLTPEFVIEELKKAMVAGTGIKATNSDTLRAVDIYARLTHSYEPRVVEQSYRVKLEKMGDKELTLELERRQKATIQLLEDINS